MPQQMPPGLTPIDQDVPEGQPDPDIAGNLPGQDELDGQPDPDIS